MNQEQTNFESTETVLTLQTQLANDATSASETVFSQVESENVDALLAQIDGLLGTDAEAFVNSYVQKGGQ